MRLLVVAVALAVAAIAQTALPTYGVASVKPSAPDERGSGIRNQGPEGGLRCVNDTVAWLISWAYGVQDYQIVGAPGWASSDRYDVSFTAGETESPEEGSGRADAVRVSRDDREKLRLQEVLRDRFGLVVHQETRILPVYVLTQVRSLLRVAADGERTSFGRSDTDPPGRITGTAAPISALRGFLAHTLQRPVNDSTGLTGLYDFTLTFDPASVSAAAAEAEQGGAGAPSLFTALDRQLGLKLESTKGPVQVLVIDKVEKPSPD